MYLVGLHIYYKMTHGPYSIKYTLFSLFTPVPNSSSLRVSLVSYKFRKHTESGYHVASSYDTWIHITAVVSSSDTRAPFIHALGCSFYQVKVQLISECVQRERRMKGYKATPRWEWSLRDVCLYPTLSFTFPDPLTVQLVGVKSRGNDMKFCSTEVLSEDWPLLLLCLVRL